jgi:hypothetical protein
MSRIGACAVLNRLSFLYIVTGTDLINRTSEALRYLAFARNSKTCPCEVDADEQHRPTGYLRKGTPALNTICPYLILEFLHFCGFK